MIDQATNRFGLLRGWFRVLAGVCALRDNNPVRVLLVDNVIWMVDFAYWSAGWFFNRC